MLCTTATNTSNTIRTQTGAAERHFSGQDSNSCYYVFKYRPTIQLQKTIRYDKRCYTDQAFPSVAMSRISACGLKHNKATAGIRLPLSGDASLVSNFQ